MTQKASPDHHSTQCPRCGQSLANYFCHHCNGKGYVREFALFKNTCSFCKGSGILFRCPDEMKHLLKDRLKRFYPIKEGTKVSNSKISNTLNPSHIPMMTNKETSNKCPFCRGSGSKTETYTKIEREPDRTVTTYESEYVPGPMGKPGRYVTKPKPTRIPGKLRTKTNTGHVSCPFCGGSGKKR
jgi:hypothetical protein